MSFDSNNNQFNLERLVNDKINGNIRGFDFFIDAPHNGKPAHIDLHVFPNEGNGIKYTNLTGVEKLRQDLGRFLPYNQHLTDSDF